MTIEVTDNPQIILNDFIARMDHIQEAVKGFEGKAEVFMAYSLQVQIESEKVRVSLELTKIEILAEILKALKRGPEK